MSRFGCIALVLATSAALPAWAQTNAPSAGSQTAQSTTTSGSADGQPSGNLSSQLSKSGGVITPKADVDPGMHVPAPDPHPNSTPVIPPSATGGSTAK